MILKGMAGVKASLDITISGRSVNYESIDGITIEVNEDLHDYACITMSGIPTRAINDYIDANVQIVLHSGAKFQHVFAGTVVTVQPTADAGVGQMNGSPFQTANIHCYGPSYRMRGSRSKVWEHTTLDQMASTLASRYGFSSSSLKPKQSVPRFVQTQESDWEALVRYAGLYGYRVNLHGTHLHVYDPLAALSRNRSLHKLSTTESGMDNHPGKVSSFKAVIGNRGMERASNVTVMDPSGVQYRLASDGEFPDQINHVVDSYAEGKTLISSDERRDYDYVANVACLGLAGVMPGGVVDLDRYRSGIDGLWYVASVKHEVSSGYFFSYLEIKKFADRPLALTSTQQYREPPASVIRNGRWESSKDLTTSYA